MRRARSILVVVAAAGIAGCTAAPRQRAVGMGDVNAGPGSLEAIRRQLQGTWDLVSIESAPEKGGPMVPVKATGTLVYDEYANLTIDARTVDPNAPVAAREVPTVSFKGRATIDPVRKELMLMNVTGNVNPNEVLSPDRRRRFEVDFESLTLSSMNANGEVTAVTKWRRRKE